MTSQERCDKCGAPKSAWDKTPCVKSLTKSPRHTITRFHIPIPGGPLDKDGWPARWSDKGYLGDGPYGA